MSLIPGRLNTYWLGSPLDSLFSDNQVAGSN